MMVAQSPISGHHRPRSGRKPLQPRNSSSSPFDTILKPNLKAAAVDCGEISISNSISISENDNKENVHPIFSLVSTPTPTPTPSATKAVKKKDYCFEMESLDASLAEELTAIREKLERLRIDKEKTDKMLREREMLLDSQMKEVIDRGMLQKHLEIEVDRLFRLKEIKLSCCTSMSPLRSLREKEREKKKKKNMQNQEQLQLKAENHSENMGDQQKDESPSDSQVKTTTTEN